MDTIKSILNQDYTNYKVFYFNNYASGQQVYNYVQENSLDRQKIKIVDDLPYTNYKDEYEYSRNYCDHVKDNIVVYMADQQVFLTQNLFTILNALFSSD